MGHWITASKAVRLLGIKRRELQRMIHDGEIETREGTVDLDALRRRFPALALRDDPVMERVQLIKSTAFTRRVGYTVIPDRESLESQVEKRNAELSLQRAQARKYRAILDELVSYLEGLRKEGDPAGRRVADQVNRWLAARLER